MEDIAPKISIIVPVYNVEQYLPQCIDSILIQTFTDFELLLINDGSLDDSGNICDEYAKKDNRIKVFHKGNNGVSSARNEGLKKVIGQYVCFADSDDSIDENYLLHLIVPLKKYDIVISGIKDVFVQKNTIEIIPSALESNNMFSIGLAIPKLDVRGLLSGVNSKLFDKTIIDNHNIEFDETFSYGEDIIFVQQYLLHVSSIKVVSYADYNYMHRNSISLSKKRYAFEIESRWANRLFSLNEEIINRFKIKDKEYLHYIGERYLLYYLSSIYTMYKNNTYKDKNKRISVIETILHTGELKKFKILYSNTLMSILSLVIFRIGIIELIDMVYKIRFRKLLQ